MSKSILMSIQPKWVCEILNGRKTIEIRRKFPKDYVGWVYVYCTKGKPFVYYVDDEVGCVEKINGEFAFRTSKNPPALNGKVVARFYCDKVEEIKSQVVNCGNDCLHTTETMNMTELLKSSCLSLKELDSYLGGENGYAIHISKLEVFDKPRELYEFNREIIVQYQKPWGELCSYLEPLTKAPQNYCYIEGEE